MRFRHPNRSGGLVKHYMDRSRPRKANPFRKRSIGFREPGCWFCLPGNRKKYILEIKNRDDED